MGSRFKADGARPWKSHDYQETHLLAIFVSEVWETLPKAADNAKTSILLCPRKPALLPKTRDVMKRLAKVPEYHTAAPRERRIFRAKKRFPGMKIPKGIKMKAATQSPPLPTFLLLGVWLLPDGVLFRSVMQQDTASCMVCRFESPGLSKGKWGWDNVPLMFELGSWKSEPQAKNRFYLFHPRQPSWVLRAWHFLFSCSFPYCQLPPCWENGIPWLENRVHLERGLVISFFLFSLFD